MDIKHNILWIDGLAALCVGILVFLTKTWLHDLYNLPMAMILLLAFANMLYATYSLFLAVHPRRTLGAIQYLVYANLSWSMACLIIIVLFLKSISIWGVTFLVAEAVFVFLLARYEWHFRFILTTQS